jgi:hypothetical protein
MSKLKEITRDNKKNLNWGKTKELLDSSQSTTIVE